MKKLFLFIFIVFSLGVFAETREATAKGHNGDIKIGVELDGKKIVSIKVLESIETKRIGDVAMEKMIAAAIEKQSADIDSISGATVTCEAFKKALKEAISK